MKEKEARRKPAKETLRTNIKDYIQKQIAAGVYRPGDRIVETQLAREMNVSQAPVREAILEMVALGMLEERPYSGHFVRALGRRRLRISIRPVPSWRNMLPNVRQTGPRRIRLAEMKRLLQEMDAKRDLDRFVHQDMEFHNLVMDAAERRRPQAGVVHVADGRVDLYRGCHYEILAGGNDSTALDDLPLFRGPAGPQLRGVYVSAHQGFGEEVSQHFADQKKKEL